MKSLKAFKWKDYLADRRLWIWAAGVLAVLFLGVVHGRDVRAGVLESGDVWLLPAYEWLFFPAMIFLAGAGWMLLLKADWKLERVFAVCALALGFFYLCALPPLSAPDEVSHYITAYKLSNQMMGKTAVDERGLVYIRAEDYVLENLSEGAEHAADGMGAVEPEAAPPANVIPEPAEHKVLGQTLTEETYRFYHEHGLFGISREGTVVSDQWPVSTTPLAYVPQAMGFVTARLLGMSCTGLLIMGRLVNLLFYVGIMYLAMRRLPFGKSILFGVGLLPMTLHLAGSLSYDVMILAMASYFTADCLHLAYRAERVRALDVAVLAAVMGILGPCKMVYAVLMGLCLLIPVRKFGGWKQWLLSAAAVLAVFLGAMILVNSQVLTVYTADTNTYVGWAEEDGYSLSQVLHNQKLLFRMFYNTLIWQAQQYHLTMIGAYLGNIDQVLDVPYLIVLGMTAALCLLALKKPGEEIEIRRGQKLWIWMLILGCAAAVLLSMLVAWTPVSSRVIAGVQGRYFLPLLPAALLTCKGESLVLRKDPDRIILYLMCCADVYAALRLFSIVSIRL